MDESKRLFGWLLGEILEQYYEGNKSKMAKDMEIDRHTLWRAFRVLDAKKGTVSSLVAQNFLWCCMRHAYSLDRPIRDYFEIWAEDNARQCHYVQGWIQEMHTGNMDIEPTVVRRIVDQVIPEWQVILGCELSKSAEGKPLAPHCRHENRCPILTLMEVVRTGADRHCDAVQEKPLEVNLSLDC